MRKQVTFLSVLISLLIWGISQKAIGQSSQIRVFKEVLEPGEKTEVEITLWNPPKGWVVSIYAVNNEWYVHFNDSSFVIEDKHLQADPRRFIFSMPIQAVHGKKVVWGQYGIIVKFYPKGSGLEENGLCTEEFINNLLARKKKADAKTIELNNRQIQLIREEDQLTKKRADLYGENRKLHQAVSDYNIILKDLSKQIQKLDGEIDNLDANIPAIQEEMTKKQHELALLSGAITFKGPEPPKGSGSVSLDGGKTWIIGLNNQATFDKLMSNIPSYREAINAMAKEMKEAKGRLEKAKTEKEELDKKKEGLAFERDAKQTDLIANNLEIQDTEKKLEEKASALKALQKEMEVHKQKLAALNQQLRQCDLAATKALNEIIKKGKKTPGVVKKLTKEQLAQAQQTSQNQTATTIEKMKAAAALERALKSYSACPPPDRTETETHEVHRETQWIKGFSHFMVIDYYIPNKSAKGGKWKSETMETVGGLANAIDWIGNISSIPVIDPRNIGKSVAEYLASEMVGTASDEMTGVIVEKLVELFKKGVIGGQPSIVRVRYTPWQIPYYVTTYEDRWIACEEGILQRHSFRYTKEETGACVCFPYEERNILLGADKSDPYVDKNAPGLTWGGGDPRYWEAVGKEALKRLQKETGRIIGRCSSDCN